MSRNQFRKLLIQCMHFFFQKNMGALLRGGILNITQLKISPDAHDAYCQISWLRGNHAWGERELLVFLRENQAAVKHYLAKRLAKTGLKKIPTFHFQIDQSVQKGAEAQHALQQVLQKIH